MRKDRLLPIRTGYIGPTLATKFLIGGDILASGISDTSFNDLPRGVATLPMDVLAAHRLPELQSPWLTAIEQGWEKYVLRDEPIPEGGAVPAPEEPAAGEMPPDYEGKTWDDILAEADGQTVKWWQWGGTDAINQWITGWVADQMKEKYNVTLNWCRLPMPPSLSTRYSERRKPDGTRAAPWI